MAAGPLPQIKEGGAPPAGAFADKATLEGELTTAADLRRFVAYSAATRVAVLSGSSRAGLRYPAVGGGAAAAGVLGNAEAEFRRMMDAYSREKGFTKQDITQAQGIASLTEALMEDGGGPDMPRIDESVVQEMVGFEAEWAERPALLAAFKKKLKETNYHEFEKVLGPHVGPDRTVGAIDVHAHTSVSAPPPPSIPLMIGPPPAQDHTLSPERKRMQHAVIIDGAPVKGYPCDNCGGLAAAPRTARAYGAGHRVAVRRRRARARRPPAIPSATPLFPPPGAPGRVCAGREPSASCFLLACQAEKFHGNPVPWAREHAFRARQYAWGITLACALGLRHGELSSLTFGDLECLPGMPWRLRVTGGADTGPKTSAPGEVQWVPLPVYPTLHCGGGAREGGPTGNEWLTAVPTCRFLFWV
eukprot:gene35891-35314_t